MTTAALGRDEPAATNVEPTPAAAPAVGGAPAGASGAAHAAPPPRRPNRLLAAFPVTIVLGAEYLGMAVWPAWRYHSHHLGFIVQIALLGALAAFAGELLAMPFGQRSERPVKPSVVTARGAKVVLVTGLAANFISAGLGARTYATQVGATHTSPLAALFTPFTWWAYIGCAFLLYAWAKGECSRRNTATWLVGTTIAFLVFAMATGLTGQIVPFGLGVTVTAMLVGFVRIPHVVALILIALLAWPTIFQLRNEHRAQLSSGFYGAELTADQRLREDVLLGMAEGLPTDLSVGQPSFSQLIRYGVVPSVLDPLPRPALRTSKLLSFRLGMSTENSMTLTVLGNMRTLGGGIVPMMFIVATLSGALSVIRRRVTPSRLALTLISMTAFFWIEATWPDAVSGFIQALVAMVAAFCALYAEAAVRVRLSRQFSTRPAVDSPSDLAKHR